MSASKDYGQVRKVEAIEAREANEDMRSTLFIELSSGVVKKTTMSFSTEQLLDIGSKIKQANSNKGVRVYIKQRGVMQEIE